MSIRIRLIAVVTVLAALVVPGVGGATGSGSHLGTGAGTAGASSLVILAPLDESTGTGTVIAGNTNASNVLVTITCVSATPNAPAGFHKMYAEGTGGGLTWYIEIGDSPSGDALDVSQNPLYSAGPCNFGLAASPVTGSFVVLP